MDYLQIMILLPCITHVVTKSRSKKHHVSSSEEETIENLLYFKDCQQKTTEAVTEAKIIELRMPSPPPPTPPPQPQCPFPKMCCSLTCGNQCENTKESSLISRQIEPMAQQQYQQIQPMMHQRQNKMPVQPLLRKRKKMKFPMNAQTPISSRRGLGFSKENIKKLINQDDDIRKILKDLVRVTMQKVDLLELQKVGRPPINEQQNFEGQIYSPPSEMMFEKPYENNNDDENDYVE